LGWWGGGGLKSLDSINTNLPVQLSLATYLRLSQSTTYWDRKTLNKEGGIGLSRTLHSFLASFKKGSKPFRNIFYLLSEPLAEKVRDRILRNYEKVTGSNQELEENCVSKFLSWWNNNFLKNRVREFLYKFTHNLLSVNSRLAHYGTNVNESCTFCVMKGALPVQRETFLHLFMDCPTVRELHDKLSDEFWPGLERDDPHARKGLWLFGIDPNGFNLIVQTTVGAIQHYIWECKIKRHPMSHDSARTFVLEHLCDYARTSNKFKNSLFNEVYPICRRVRQL
jgi:zinc-binding in reverse transcriptase